MNKFFLLTFISICSVFSCNAQSNIETSPFINVPVMARLIPITPPAKKDLKSLSKYSKYSSFPDIGNSILDFDVKVDCFRLPDGNTAAFFTTQIGDEELSLENRNNIQTSGVKISGKITSIDKKVDGTFEDITIFTQETTSLKATTSAGKRSYIKGILLPPNDYKITLLIRDAATGKPGIKSLNFTVPNFQAS